MSINNVVVSGRLTKDAQIVESDDRPGRFDVEFVIAINHKRNAASISEKTTFLTVTMNTTEKGAVFFSRSLYKGRAVLVVGGICSRTSLAPGKSSPSIYLEAASIAAMGDERPAAQSMQCGPEGMIESEPPMEERAPVKPAPRVLAVQRPGAQPPPESSTPAPTHQYASPGQSHGYTSDAAALYRDKGMSSAEAGGSVDLNLCRW
ncbi:single-stranded DNA-binding protein [Xanthomonas hortorum pv. gardneri]|uniref:single-stranded DNA-binding protein n=1 Tax=Xanthomonas hortorum TaxID=56454 RepID=UPI002FE01D9C